MAVDLQPHEYVNISHHFLVHTVRVKGLISEEKPINWNSVFVKTGFTFLHVKNTRLF